VRGAEPPLASATPPGWRPPAESGVRLQIPNVAGPDSPKPAVSENGLPTPSLPVGISQFNTAKENVAVGLRPLQDGWDWLKESGYRSVLHLRQAGENDLADRQQAEKRGLRFLSLEVSLPLSKATVSEFNRLAADRAAQPLFIYDKDGVLTGGLWYLYFRTVDKATDDEARAKASRLGLKEEQDADNRLMWLAIQRYVSEQLR
jgi:hypothetical protein